MVRGTQGEEEMEEAVPGGSGVAREEAEKERVITTSVSGITTPRSAGDVGRRGDPPDVERHTFKVLFQLKM